MKNIFITGGTGCLGSDFIKRYSREYNIFAIVRPVSSYSNIETYCNIVKLENMERCFQDNKIDLVLNLAGNVGKRTQPKDYSTLANDNIMFGIEILRLMKLYNVSRIIQAGAGFQQRLGIEEYAPANLYAAMKQAFEDILKYFSDKQNINVINLVFFYTYSVDDKQPRIFNILTKAILDGRPEFDMTDCQHFVNFIHISDVMKAINLTIKLMLDNEIRNDKFYVAAENIKMKEAVEIYQKVTGDKIKINFGALPSPEEYVPMPFIGKKLPNWKPVVSLEEGLKDFVKLLYR